MFSNSGFFNNVPCPDKHNCKRPQCLFSHAPNAKQPATPSNNAITSNETPQRKPIATFHTIPSKRAASSSIKSYASTATTSTQEPPRKVQRLDAAAKSTKVSASQKTIGVPILKMSPAHSKVAIPVRQAMLKTIYEHFAELYSDILGREPSLASGHALAQEDEVYQSSTKLTYRNAVISCVASLKKRKKPDSLTHESVGTEGTLQKRRDTHDKLRALKLTKKHLSPHIMPLEAMQKWGFMTEIPDSPGSSNPSDEGKIKQCERCNEQFVVKRKEEAGECVYHWGRAIMNRMNGEKLRVWSCCSEVASDTKGCSRGPHVFSESSPEELHARHAFSFTSPAIEDPDTLDTALEVVCLDCEMIYTTGGVRVARVSVVDGSGQEIFDELVKMDEDVEVIDYNTRFSGITEEEYKEKAVLPLKSIRRALDAFINSDTIIIGHALENDLKTLRMVHLKCVDTAILFPHRAGPPYRRALRDLTRELLSRKIQTGGGTSGHSSVEDSIATLDLVRYFVINNPEGKKPVAAGSTTGKSTMTKST
ncbi:uncharacterized protein FOMMEDRAFT_110616 [Fomitiporia mediterranea MF3/22]|uniref:uncharacterized protein n=1 Tax=Fomitiporia mediterranea (strain MF3/22) TaxID=694068 RepID=UPI0004409BEA|nr:uncharacterized protein FOMMEDRAFT_110616 [Fomitiporia mediterranea MF3/22]EJD01091.1 hypothetical protein FOMMEDRAFT_110616 [Fomitiporia mediterranea MF3/22]